MTSLFLAPNVHLPTSCTPHLSIVVQDQTVHTHTTPIYDRSNHPPATNVTRSLEREAATRLLWRLPFEPDERMDPHHMRSAHRLVRRNTLVYYIYIVMALTRLSVVALSLTRSGYAAGTHLPKPDILPPIHADFGPYLSFDLNYSAIWAITTELYYFILTPGVTVSLVTRT